MSMLFHVAIATSFIALVIGTAFLLWLKKQEIANGFAKLVGYASILFSIGGIVCAIYYGVQYWQNGYYKAANVITFDEQSMGMMNKMMERH